MYMPKHEWSLGWIGIMGEWLSMSDLQVEAAVVVAYLLRQSRGRQQGRAIRLKQHS